jgi:hypothetical protein
MGVVYKARQAKLNRIVALKMILGGAHAGSEERLRFLGEAEAVAALSHPGIVQVYEFGTHGGLPYFALEYCPGGSLAERLKGTPLSPGRAAALIETLAEAVQAAHECGIVHRDLKPANVLLSSDEQPKVTDFGLAKRLEGGTSLTQTGAVVGTPSYMAPEQAAGGAKHVGPACDVYALGAILYECLTGRPPFKAPSPMETLAQVIADDPVPPRSLQRTVPVDLETVCLKCLAKEPHKRYASAAELADDLARYQKGEPIRARPVGRLERSVKWVKRNPVLSGAVVAVVLSLTVGTLVSYLKYLDAEQQKGLALQEADKAGKARDFLVRLFQLSETDVKGGNAAARLVLAEAEKRIPKEFADQPELRADLMTSIGKVKRVIGRRTPQAMILEVRGTVQLQSATRVNRMARAQTLLNLDDRLSLSADAQVQLVFLSDLHKERLKPGREVTIDSKGCDPADAILERDNSVLMTFVRLPKGTFYMGWDDSVKKKGVKTEIKADFEIAVHDVTQGQWQAVMGNNPSYFSRQGSGRNDLLDLSDEELGVTGRPLFDNL